MDHLHQEYAQNMFAPLVLIFDFIWLPSSDHFDETERTIDEYYVV